MVYLKNNKYIKNIRKYKLTDFSENYSAFNQTFCYNNYKYAFNVIKKLIENIAF